MCFVIVTPVLLRAIKSCLFFQDYKTDRSCTHKYDLSRKLPRYNLHVRSVIGIHLSNDHRPLMWMEIDDMPSKTDYICDGLSKSGTVLATKNERGNGFIRRKRQFLCCASLLLRAFPFDRDCLCA